MDAPDEQPKPEQPPVPEHQPDTVARPDPEKLSSDPEPPDIDLEYLPIARQGKIQMALHIGSASFTDKFDVTDAEGRAKFVKQVLEKYPALNVTELESELIKIGGEIAERNMAGKGDAAPQGDGEEGDSFGDGGDAAVLVGIVTKDGVELLHAGSRHDAEAFATIQVERHKETWPIKSTGFAHWLRRRFYEFTERAPVAQSFTDAINLLSAIAMFEGEECPVFVRVAEHEGDIWLDLADDQWRAVRITKSGWEVVEGDNVLVKFVRRRGMLPLPVPVAGGTIDELRRFVNMPTDDLWVLYAGSLIALFRPRGPYIVIVFTGQQGSAKSSTARKTRALVDPNKSPLRRLTRDDRDLMIAANNAFVLAFDNLSHIPPAISDALCSLATGGGFSTRQLYTDDEEKLFDAMRPVMLNGIEDIATRADLLDRAVLFNLPAMDEKKLREEAELDREFEEARPRILGALLNAASEALRRFESIVLERKPRMVDFAKWVTAGETAFGWKPGTFLDAYMRNRGDAHAIAMESSTVGAPLLALVEKEREWTGTHGELLKLLEDDLYADKKTRERKDWPQTPKGLSDAIRRLIPTLRALGVEVIAGERKSGGKRERQITLRRITPEKPSDGAGQSRDGAENERPGESAPGGAEKADSGRWDGRDVGVPPSQKNGVAAGDDRGEQRPAAAAGESAANKKVGTEPSQASQPSRNGPGAPENAVREGRLRDGAPVSGTVAGEEVEYL
jgi:hypothetical protein